MRNTQAVKTFAFAAAKTIERVKKSNIICVLTYMQFWRLQNVDYAGKEKNYMNDNKEQKQNLLKH